MGLGRENPSNPQEQFCMTVLGLRLARRANAVSALHGEVSRAMWTGLFPEQDRRYGSDRPHHQWRARAHLAGASNVPALRPPSRHGLARAQRRVAHLGRHRKRRRRRALGNPSQPESAAAGIRAAPRGGTSRAPGGIPGDTPQAQPDPEPRRADHRFRPPLRHVQDEPT